MHVVEDEVARVPNLARVVGMLGVIQESDFDAIVVWIGGIITEKPSKFNQAVVKRQSVLIEVYPVFDSERELAVHVYITEVGLVRPFDLVP